METYKFQVTGVYFSNSPNKVSLGVGGRGVVTLLLRR